MSLENYRVYGSLLLSISLAHDHNTVNDETFEGERLYGFCLFLINRKVFPTNFNTQKLFLFLF